MTLADVFTVVFLILGMLITLPALWLLLKALFPAAVGRSRDRIAATPIRCFLAGIVPAFASVALMAQPAPPVKGVGVLLFLGLVLLAGIGMAGLSTIVGERLPSAADEGRPWRGLVRGAVCLELAFLLPVVGWLGLLPIALVTGLGAALIGLIAPKAAAPAVPAAA